jgi:hypothetical protein
MFRSRSDFRLNIATNLDFIILPNLDNARLSRNPPRDLLSSLDPCAVLFGMLRHQRYAVLFQNPRNLALELFGGPVNAGKRSRSTAL